MHVTWVEEAKMHHKNGVVLVVEVDQFSAGAFKLGLSGHQCPSQKLTRGGRGGMVTRQVPQCASSPLLKPFWGVIMTTDRF